MADNRPIVANLDFQSVKDDLIDHFKSRPEFADYEFTGSGLNMLMDILAYNTHYNSLAANFLVNEMFLDSAVMRNNVVSIAKMLNYTPRSARGAKTKITLNVPRLNNESFTIIPAGTLFAARDGNSSLNFYTIKDHTLNFSVGDVTRDIEVEIHEGTLITQRFTMSNANEEFPKFDLGDGLVDLSTLTVALNGIKYAKVTPEDEGVVASDSTSRIYFLEETRNQSFRILFGNNVIGKKPEIGDEIICSYLVCNGEAGNGVSRFTVSLPGRTGAAQKIGTTVNPAQGGSNPETIREIKDTAPHWYQSQFRAVTENDYAAFIKKKFADIQALSVYGGEKVGQPGNVFIAIKPKSGDKLSDSTKNTILNEVLTGTNVVTVRPKIVDPFIMKIVLKTIITYDDKLLATSREILQAKTISLFERFNTNYIGSFLETFRESQLAEEIKAVDKSIISTNTRVSLRVDTVATGGILSTYRWFFGNKLYHPFEGFNAAKGGIFSSTLFNRVGRTFQSGFDEDGKGNIRLFDFIDGEKVFVNQKAGTINYVTGEIHLFDFDPDDGPIQFTAIPDSFDVIADNNTVLEITSDTSVVEAVEKNEVATLKNINLSRSS